MQKQPRLFSHTPLTLHSDWLAALVKQYFDLVITDTVQSLSVHDCYYTDQWNETAKNFAVAGKKVVMDRLWEPAFKPVDQYPCFVLQNNNWFWYQESLWYLFLNYHHYKPNRSWRYRALMPMRRVKQTRDYIVHYLDSHLDSFLWSYQEKHRHLPNSGDPNDWNTQRLFQPEWYDQTAMSLVAETLSRSDSIMIPFVSEKSFKPIAFYHPFVVCGDFGTLRYLQTLGFETFENLFDEQYDSISNWQERFETAMNQCLSAQFADNGYDLITEKKLVHNHYHFFDQSLVEQKIITEVLEPLRHYAET